MTTTTLPLNTHDDAFRKDPVPTEALPNVFEGRTIFVSDVPRYDLVRSMLYALGAKAVAYRSVPGVDMILYGAPIPSKTLAKFPTAERVSASGVLPLFRQRVPSFAAFLRALEEQGFTVRNGSDEGDPDLCVLDEPLSEGSLHATLVHWLNTAPFLSGFCGKQYFPIDKREPQFLEFSVPGSEGLTWYYAWDASAFGHISAQRGDGPYPLTIKGSELMSVLPIFYTQTTGMYVYEYPEKESITGLFVVAGVEAATGKVSGVGLSRVWT